MRTFVITIATVLSSLLLTITATTSLQAQKLDEMSLDRWKLLRETERYQMQIAENYYRDKNWKVAAAEYEKFQSLYEKSEGASFAQLKWSICQVHLRKQNTAIKDGFQAVIDYWPESQDAVSAAFYIGHTYKSIGQLPKAKPAYRAVIEKHPNEVVAVFAMWDLVDIATLDKDVKTRFELLRKLAFEVKRTGATSSICTQASQQLATLSFETGAFEEGQKALATVYSATQLPSHIISYFRAPFAQLAGGKTEDKTKAEKMADAAVGYYRTTIAGLAATDEAKPIARQNWYAIADTYAIANRDDKVGETYDQLAKALGKTDEALGRFAAFHKSRNKYEEARNIYRQYQDQAAGLGAVAYSYREQSNYEPAVKTYNQLIGQDAANAVKWKAELAATWRAAKKAKEAGDAYTDLIATDSPNAAKWRWEMANMYRELGHYKDAIAHYRQCDNFPENFKYMASCHRQLKEYKEAVMLYNQIVGGDPGNAPWALLQVANTLEDSGDKDRAIQTFQAVCKKFPKDQHASTAHAHLQNKYKISVTLGGAKDEGPGK